MGALGGDARVPLPGYGGRREERDHRFSFRFGGEVGMTSLGRRAGVLASASLALDVTAGTLFDSALRCVVRPSLFFCFAEVLNPLFSFCLSLSAV